MDAGLHPTFEADFACRDGLTKLAGLKRNRKLIPDSYLPKTRRGRTTRVMPAPGP